MLDVDTAGEIAAQIADEFLIRRRVLERILHEDIQLMIITLYRTLLRASIKSLHIPFYEVGHLLQ